MHAEDFVGLFNSIYSRRIDSSYYYWRFGRQDCNGFILFSEDKDGLKGCIGYHLLDVDRFKVALIVDAMVAPRCRDGRTFFHLSRRLENCARHHGAKALLMLPNENGAKAWTADKEWALAEYMVSYTHRVRTDGLGALRHFKVDRFGQWVDRIETKFSMNNPELRHARRTKDYLNWRFSNPMHDYEIYQVYRGGKSLPFGYMVLKVFTDPVTAEQTGDIVDIMWCENDAPALMDMLRVALRRFHTHGIRNVSMWLQTNTLLDAVGRCIGFTPTDRHRAFCVKILDRDYSALAFPENWFLTMADSEVY